MTEENIGMYFLLRNIHIVMYVHPQLLLCVCVRVCVHIVQPMNSLTCNF